MTATKTKLSIKTSTRPYTRRPQIRMTTTTGSQAITSFLMLTCLTEGFSECSQLICTLLTEIHQPVDINYAKIPLNAICIQYRRKRHIGVALFKCDDVTLVTLLSHENQLGKSL